MQFIQTGGTFGGGTFYLGFGSTTPSSNVTQKQAVLAFAIEAKHLAVRFKTPNGGSQSTTFTVLKNGSPTGLSVTNTDTDNVVKTIGIIGSESFNSEDTISIKVETTLAPINIESFSVGYFEL